MPSIPFINSHKKRLPGNRCQGSAWNGITLGVNVGSTTLSTDLFRSAVEAGARAVAGPVRREWGGYSGYIADPEGNRWGDYLGARLIGGSEPDSCGTGPAHLV